MNPVHHLAATFALLLLAAVSLPTRANGKALVIPETASGNFLATSDQNTLPDRTQLVEHSLEKVGCGDESASGRPKWPSRDPIGERGGDNLFVFVVNNPQNFVDSLGLEFIGPTSGTPTVVEEPAPDNAYGFTTPIRTKLELDCMPCENGCYKIVKRRFDVIVSSSTAWAKINVSINGKITEVRLPETLIDDLVRHEQRHIDDARAFHDLWDGALDATLAITANCNIASKILCDRYKHYLWNKVMDASIAHGAGPGAHLPPVNWPEVDKFNEDIQRFKDSLQPAPVRPAPVKRTFWDRIVDIFK